MFALNQQIHPISLLHFQHDSLTTSLAWVEKIINQPIPVLVLYFVCLYDILIDRAIRAITIC